MALARAPPAGCKPSSLGVVARLLESKARLRPSVLPLAYLQSLELLRSRLCA